MTEGAEGGGQLFQDPSAMATREARPAGGQRGKPGRTARALVAALELGASASGMCLSAAWPQGVDIGASHPSASWRIVHADDTLLVVGFRRFTLSEWMAQFPQPVCSTLCRWTRVLGC